MFGRNGLWNLKALILIVRFLIVGTCVADGSYKMFIYQRKDGKRYKLVQNKAIVKGGKEVKVYYFIAEDAKLKSGKLIDTLPDGYKITEIGRAGNHPIVSKVSLINQRHS